MTIYKYALSLRNRERERERETERETGRRQIYTYMCKSITLNLDTVPGAQRENVRIVAEPCQNHYIL